MLGSYSTSQVLYIIVKRGSYRPVLRDLKSELIEIQIVPFFYNEYILFECCSQTVWCSIFCR